MKANRSNEGKTRSAGRTAQKEARKGRRRKDGAGGCGGAGVAPQKEAETEESCAGKAREKQSRRPRGEEQTDVDRRGRKSGKGRRAPGRARHLGPRRQGAVRRLGGPQAHPAPLRTPKKNKLARWPEAEHWAKGPRSTQMEARAGDPKAPGQAGPGARGPYTGQRPKARGRRCGHVTPRAPGPRWPGGPGARILGQRPKGRGRGAGMGPQRARAKGPLHLQIRRGTVAPA